MKKPILLYKKNKIPTFIGVFLLLLGISTGVIIIKRKQIFRLGADQSTYPSNIRISNATDSSINISWTTDAETFGFIRYGKTPLLLDITILPENKTQTNTHYFKIENLREEEKYFFTINSNGIDYLNEKSPFQFVTANKIPKTNEGIVLYGQVYSKNAQPQSDAIVYATVGGSSLLSTKTAKDGTWAIPISSAKTKDLRSYIQIDERNTVVELEILTNNNNVSSVTTYPQTAKPLPPVILGNSYDYRQNPAVEVQDYVPRSETSPLTNFSN